jgi:hypothetical protein
MQSPSSQSSSSVRHSTAKQSNTPTAEQVVHFSFDCESNHDLEHHLDDALDQLCCEHEDVFEPSATSAVEQSTVGPLVSIQSRRARFQRAHSCPQEQLLPSLATRHQGFQSNAFSSSSFASNPFAVRRSSDQRSSSHSSTLTDTSNAATATTSTVASSTVQRRLSRLRAFSSLDHGPGKRTRSFATASARWASEYPVDDIAAARVLKAKLKTLGRQFYLDGGYGHVIAVITTIALCLLDTLQLSLPLVAHFLRQQKYARTSLIHPRKSRFAKNRIDI